jgi:phosphotransferase system HPr (HPr) family protein
MSSSTGLEIQARTFEVTNRCGLHVGPIDRLFQTSRQFGCRLYINVGENPEHPAWEKTSCMGLSSMAVSCGGHITLGVVGKDSSECLSAIEHLFREEFQKLDISRSKTSAGHALCMPWRQAVVV